jgi:hypothetical protein
MTTESPLLAFGAYVSSLSVSLGWGGQGGAMQLKLVEDPPNGKVINLPAIGTAVYFRYEGFYFAGVLQRWTYNESISGRTYDVIIESPAKLMDGVQVIIENFNGATDYWAYTEQCSIDEYTTNVTSSGGGTGDGGTVGGGSPSPNLLYGDPVYNVYNVFGYYENPEFGTGGQYVNYGQSNFNSAGLQVSKILDGLSAISQRQKENFKGPIRFGTGKTGNSSSGSGGGLGGGSNSGSDDYSEYELDITELNELNAAGTFADYRLKGPVKSVNTILSEMADLFQFDYYYTIIEDTSGTGDPNPETNGAGSITNPIIKVKVLDRSEPPQSGKVAEFIQEKKDSGTLISSQIGFEFGDTVTQKIVWGGNRSRYLKLRNTQASGISQSTIFGRKPTNAQGIRPLNIGPPITTVHDENPFQTFEIFIEGKDIVPGQQPVETLATGEIYSWQTSPFEMRMALGGKECWEAFKTFQTLVGEEIDRRGLAQGLFEPFPPLFDEQIFTREPNGFNRTIGPLTKFDTQKVAPWAAAFDNTNNILTLIAEGVEAAAVDATLSNPDIAAKRVAKERERQVDRLYSAIANVAKASYGQEYLILLPNERPEPQYNYYLPDGEYTYLKTWDVASSAFDSRPVTFDIQTWDGLGRVKGMPGYPFVGKNFWSNDQNPSYFNPLDWSAPFAFPDFSAFGKDFAWGIDHEDGSLCNYEGFIFTTKGGPDTESFWNDTFGSWFVLYKTTQVRLFDSITTPDFGLTVLAKLAFNADIPPSVYIPINKSDLQIPIPPDITPPRLFGVPQESTRFRWGPWVTKPESAGFSNNGKAQTEEKESLKPEVFGSIAELRAIGELEASVGESTMQTVESGYVEVAGAPEYNLGERFADSGPYVSNMDISVDVSGGVKTTYKLNTWTPEFGTMNKYNINRIGDIKKRAFEYAKKQSGLIDRRPFPQIEFTKTNFQDSLNNSQRAQGNALLSLFAQQGRGSGGFCPVEVCGKGR